MVKSRYKDRCCGPGVRVFCMGDRVVHGETV